MQIAAAPLSEWFSPRGKPVDATLAFITDDSIALRLCEAYPTSNCKLLVIQIAGEKLQAVAQTTDSRPLGSLYRSGDYGILNTFLNRQRAQLYSSDLQTRQPQPGPVGVSRTGKTILSYERDDGWFVYRTGNHLPLRKIRETEGHLMAISDELVVLRKDNTILAESFDGKQLGSFRVKPLTKCSTWIEVIDRNRFYLDGCGKAWTVDLSGRKLVHLQPPTGWGVRHGWSADGKRILFDHYIRSVPFWEAFTDAIFLNDYTPSTGEVVRVQYTTNGGICFEWGDPKHLVGEGDYHADISPSGRYVALVTGGFLSIYRLAEECSKK